MKKIILLFVLAFLNMQAQTKNVGINIASPDPSAILDIYAQDRGFLGPKVELTSRTDQSTLGTTPAGMMVYNTRIQLGTVDTELIKSYYYWNGSQWIAMNTGYNNNKIAGQDITFVQTLGYNPTGYVNSQNIIVGPVQNGTNTYTRIGCYKWDTGTNANGHRYCAYKIGTSPLIPSNLTDLTQNATWANAFNMSKTVGGYMPTITNNEEWQMIKTNILNLNVATISGTTYKVKDYTSWIGMNKVTYAGNAKEFIWITGERSSSLGNTAIPFGPFNGGEPNDTDNDEGCVQILSPTVSTTNEWNDLSCTATYSARFGVILVEFDN
ncbi:MULTISPECIES: C-type lectin domain-containing protein [unclassified Kaistella]|nr:MULTISPECIES: C-type lectin domain-containing protein [unclassified Kaistella]MDP2454626.1 C-type lectin domain-containing protein [Kaistella sp. SH11-4b]MDP2460123.1 C-type lectin domain-containing protein [Kaistella sp. SH19-2b]